MQLCQLCEREVDVTTKHHLIPKQKFNKKWRRIYRESGLKHWQRTINVCVPCSKQVHAIFTNKELAEEYNTITKLKETESIKKWVGWVREHNPGSHKYKYW